MRRQFTSFEWQTIQQRPSERKQLEIFMRHWVGSFSRAYFLIISLVLTMYEIIYSTCQKLEFTLNSIKKTFSGFN